MVLWCYSAIVLWCYGLFRGVCCPGWQCNSHSTELETCHRFRFSSGVGLLTTYSCSLLALDPLLMSTDSKRGSRGRLYRNGASVTLAADLRCIGCIGWLWLQVSRTDAELWDKAVIQLCDIVCKLVRESVKDMNYKKVDKTWIVVNEWLWWLACWQALSCVRMLRTRGIQHDKPNSFNSVLKGVSCFLELYFYAACFGRHSYRISIRSSALSLLGHGDSLRVYLVPQCQRNVVPKNIWAAANSVVASGCELWNNSHFQSGARSFNRLHRWGQNVCQESRNQNSNYSARSCSHRGRRLIRWTGMITILKSRSRMFDKYPWLYFWLTHNWNSWRSLA